MDFATTLVLVAWGCPMLAVAAGWAARRALGRRRRTGRWRWGILAIAAALVAIVAAPAGGYALWYRYRPRPDSTRRLIAPGIEYRRLLREEPRRLVVHVATIELGNPSVRVVLREPRSDGSFAARTVRDIATDLDADLAVNGQYFGPFESHGPLEYYPHAGDPIRVAGRSAYHGRLFQSRRWKGSTIFIAEDGSVSVEEPTGGVYDALSGSELLVEGGRRTVEPKDWVGPAPRTAAGLDAARTTLILVVVDGRQPGYSEGLTLVEMGDLMVDLGADWAIELDGGGSSTMVGRAADGDLEVLDSPIHGHIPGRERPVANVIAVRGGSADDGP